MNQSNINDAKADCGEDADISDVCIEENLDCKRLNKTP